MTWVGGEGWGHFSTSCTCHFNSSTTLYTWRMKTLPYALKWNMEFLPLFYFFPPWELFFPVKSFLFFKKVLGIFFGAKNRSCIVLSCVRLDQQWCPTEPQSQSALVEKLGSQFDLEKKLKRILHSTFSFYDQYQLYISACKTHIHTICLALICILLLPNSASSPVKEHSVLSSLWERAGGNLEWRTALL